MALDFGKLNYNTSLNPTSAFPLDARSYFESLDAALEAAGTAEVAGSTNTVYYYGQIVSVVENNVAELYVITPNKSLKKVTAEVSAFYVGYLLNGKFYADSTYTQELPKSNTKIYADLNGTGFYMYYGDLVGFKPFVNLPAASEESAGIMRLYNAAGSNTDGTMTQKAVTDGVNSIKFALEQVPDEDGDGVAENVLVLDLPWA